MHTLPSCVSHIWSNREWAGALFSVIKAKQSHVAPKQEVSNTTFVLCQAFSSSWCFISWLIVGGWLSLIPSQEVPSCLCIPWLTGSEWHCFIYLPGSLITHVSSNNQQFVSVIASFLCQAVSSIMSHPTWPTVCEWHYFISLPSSLISHPTWLTVCEWHCFISLPGSLTMNHVSSHDQQHVNDHDTTLFSARQSHQSCLILAWLTGSEWHCFISLPGNLINHVSCHDQQAVSDTALFLCWQAISSTSCLFPWPTGSEWHCFISLPGNLINCVSSHDQQEVSDTALFLCQAVSSIVSHPMTNRKWVTICLPGSLINHVSSHDQQFVSDTTLFLYQAVSFLIPLD